MDTWTDTPTKCKACGKSFMYPESVTVTEWDKGPCGYAPVRTVLRCPHCGTEDYRS